MVEGGPGSEQWEWRILLIDDDAALLDVLAVAFQAAGHHVERSRDGAAALAQLQRSPPDPAVTIPLPWAKTTNPRPAPQPPLAGTPSGDDAKPRTGTGTAGGADGQGSASGGSKAPSTR